MGTHTLSCTYVLTRRNTPTHGAVQRTPLSIRRLGVVSCCKCAVTSQIRQCEGTPTQRARRCRPSVRTCATLHRSMRSHAPAHCLRARVSMPLHMGAGRGAKDRRGVEGLFALSHRARGIGTESRCVAICFPGFDFTPSEYPGVPSKWYIWIGTEGSACHGTLLVV